MLYNFINKKEIQIMKKQLSEMSLEELWQLFPIILKEYNLDYQNWYELEKDRILNNIKTGDIARINHIGSSAVKGLISKPTIDILLEVNSCDNIKELIADLELIGWGLMSQKNDPLKLSFCKGYTPNGFAEKVYHLHVVYHDDWDELYFRDFLIMHPDIANEYGKLKLQLLNDFKQDRDGYTKAKTNFILKYSNIAKQEFPERYKPIKK